MIVNVVINMHFLLPISRYWFQCPCRVHQGRHERPVRSIGDHLRSQNYCPRARKIRAVLDTHQDIIGNDVPVNSRILPEHNEHGVSEGHGKEDVTSKVSDPPFTNLVQRSDNDEKFMLIG